MGQRWLEFAQGYGIGQKMVNDYNDTQKKKEIKDLMDEKETPSFTADQELARTAMANAVDANGNKIYDFSADDKGNITTTLNKDAVPNAAPEAYQPVQMARGGVTYLGKNYNAPLTDTQRLEAQGLAMSDVMAKYGDAEGALRARREVKRDSQADQMFEINKSQAERTARQAARDEEYQTGRQDAFNNSIYGQKNAQFAQQYQAYLGDKQKYDEAIAAGQSPQQLGLPPQAPTRPAYTVADSLADQGSLLAHDAKYGKVSTKDFGDFTDRLRRVEEEGYLKALNLAQGGGSIEQVAKAFNATGTMKLDPQNVVSDQMVKGAGGVPERVITVRDDQGNTHTINVMSELKSLGKAHDALSAFYQGEANTRGNAELTLHQNADTRAAELAPVQKANLQATTAHTQASTGVLNQQLQDRKDLDKVRTDLNTAIDNNDEAGIKTGRAKLMNYMLSGKSGMQSMSAEERKANFYLASGAAKTPADAARMAHEKVQTSAKDDYMALMKPNSTGLVPKAEDIEPIMTAMHGSEWKTKLGQTAAPAAASKPTNEDDAQAQAKAAVAGGADKAAVNARLKTMGFKPID